MAATPPPRIFAVSDVHSDYPDNLAWVESLAGRYGPADAIIVAGDVSDCTETLLRTLRAFKAAFHSVFFVPGNHDVWLRSAERDKHADSLAKWRSLEAALESAGVSTTPARVGSGPAAPWVVPMLSWYEPEWDTEPDIEGAAAARDIFTDFRACVWPRGLGDAGAEADLAAAWDALNEPALTRATDEINRVADGVPRPPVISVSHFLPVQSCLPEKRYLFHPALAKACGSRPLAARVAALRPDVHVFGHTHIAMDTTVDGVRYVQHPLRYPAERRRAGVAAAEVEPQKIFDCAANAQGPRALTHWSQHYDVVARNPADVTPAPWVVASWGRRGGGGKGGGE